MDDKLNKPNKLHKSTQFTTENRPKLDLPFTPFQKISTIISFLLLAGNIAYIILEWPTLPEKFPGHFNGAGEVDRWGSKGEVWLLPIIGLVLWTLLTILEKYPHIYNYINYTPQNGKQQYKYGRMLINVLKLFISIFFVYISIESIQIARGNEFGLGIWELPIFIGTLFGIMGFYFFKVIRLK